MDLIGVVARTNTISLDYIIYTISRSIDSRSLYTGPFDDAYSIPLFQRILITWLFLYTGALFLYYIMAGLDYYIVFVKFQNHFIPEYKPDYKEIRREIAMSTWSLGVMSMFTTPMEVLVQLGYSRVYHDINDYGRWWFFLSPIAFLIFSDSLIYFIHRGLHHRLIYKYIHKPHHSFIHTTPFAAFAFHPVDGFLQGVPYQLFTFVFPFHATLHLLTLATVGIWTINIHDRTTMKLPFVNGAAHHNIHHTTFKSNYGQYFTFWDRFCGTFRDPIIWEKEGSQVQSEESVYGKKFL